MSAPIGGWATRIPDLRDRVGASDVEWGVSNTAASVGNVAGLVLLVVLAGRVRNELLGPVGAVLVLIVVPLTAAATSLSVLIAGLVVWAVAAHLMDVPMGVMALGVQTTHQRPIMGAFDACFAGGVLAGAAVGTSCAAVGVPPWAQLTGVSTVQVAVLFGTVRWLPPTAAATEVSLAASLRRRIDRRMAPLAAVAFLGAFVSESSVLWCAIYIAETLEGGPVAGAAVYTCATLAGAIALLGVDRAAARWGSVRLVRVATVVGSVTFGLALFSTNVIVAACGFVVLTVAMATVNPTIYTLAGDQPFLIASESVSVVETAQAPGAAIAAPALIAMFAAVAGLQAALTAVAAATLGIGLMITRAQQQLHR